jgi:uncharacterized C2H2 Zn-finger protein
MFNPFKKYSKQKTKDRSKLYKCPECGFLYKEKEWADKCQAWCKKHHTCNLEITEQATTESYQNK